MTEPAGAGRGEEGLLGLVLNSVQEGVLGVGADGRITFANPAACRHLGRTQEELLGKSEHEILHPTRADGTPYDIARCPIHATLHDGGVHHSYGEVFHRRDGATFPVDYTATPLREGGRLVGAAVIFTDTRDRTRAEEVERRARERLTRIYESLPDGFFLLDREWHVVYVNAAASRMKPPSVREPVIGRIIWEVYPQLLGTPYEEAFRRAMRDNVAVRIEGTGPETPGLWVEMNIYPTEEGLSVYVRDISARRRAEDEAKAASIARPLARKIIQDLVETGGVAHQILTQVGRNLAAGTASRTMDEFVGHFAEMGLGKVGVDRAEGQRYSFSGSDLLEKRPGSRVATCSFTLGYLAEAVSRIHANEPTLGTEIECQSRGAKECKFVVQVKKPEEGLARRVKELV